jgi:hypothetical protein
MCELGVWLSYVAFGVYGRCAHVLVYVGDLYTMVCDVVWGISVPYFDTSLTGCLYELLCCYWLMVYMDVVHTC